MSFMLTRMFGYFTLASYLMVGTVAVRIFAPEMSTVSFSTSYSKLFSNTELKDPSADSLETPNIVFSEFRFPEEKKVHAVVPMAKKKVAEKPVMLNYRRVTKNELPFYEQVQLHAITSNIQNYQNFVALYQDFNSEMVAATDMVSDEVSTNQASVIDAEPEFFEYSTQPDQAPAKDQNSSTVAEVINTVEEPKAVDNSGEEVAIDDLIAFDYSKASQDVKAQTMPTVSKMTTQTASNVHISNNLTVTTQPSTKTVAPQRNKLSTPNLPQATQNEESGAGDKAKHFVDNNDYSSRLSIQVVGTDLSQTQVLSGFEARLQDDLSEIIQDNNTGYATLEAKLSSSSMTRSVSILKNGFAPTNTEVALTADDTIVTLPLIQSEKFNELQAPFAGRGDFGAVLVELDREHLAASELSAPFGNVLHLNGNMEITQEDDFSYVLYLGVPAGNAEIKYKDNQDRLYSKLVHIHTGELTYNAFEAEAVLNEKVSLMEEDLLGNEVNPLIISSEEVKEFNTNKTTNKVDNHTYETFFGSTLLGQRKYLELTHLRESVIVGYKDAQAVVVPSEAFMRHIVSSFEGSGQGNRCLVQINLSKIASGFEVASESIDKSIMTYTQVLDTDGKFYDSVGPKSKKILIVGENQSSHESASKGKINVKITYEDGSIETLGSYCAPNSYLVEQL